MIYVSTITETHLGWKRFESSDFAQLKKNVATSKFDAFAAVMRESYSCTVSNDRGSLSANFSVVGKVNSSMSHGCLC